MKPSYAELTAVLAPFSAPDEPGTAVLVVRQGEIIYQHTGGLADLEAGTPITPATNFRLASLTKQFTATAVMILAERGQLTLDDPLAAFLPSLPAGNPPITLRHLLTHTAGLPDYEDLIPPTTAQPLTDHDVLRLLQSQPNPYFPAGSAYRYSNTGYALLALVVEAASGFSFAAFLQEAIFGPLGMAHTVAYEAGVTTIAQRAYGYRATTSGFVRADQSLTSSVLGDGGVYSSLNDLYRWDQALYVGALVSAPLWRQAFTPASVGGVATGYGLGWFVEEAHGRRRLWHYGSTTGFRTAIERFPDEQFTVIVLMNRDEPGPDELLARHLARQVIGAGQWLTVNSQLKE